jgi:hypothetical protein
MTNTNITQAERATLSLILASGGLNDRKVHMGKKVPGFARRTVVQKLIKKGLVECVGMGARTSLGIAEDYVYFATAAGCVAFGPEIARG